MIFPDPELLQSFFYLFYQYYFQFIFQNGSPKVKFFILPYKDIIINYAIDLTVAKKSICTSIYQYDNKKYLNLCLYGGEDSNLFISQEMKDLCTNHPSIFEFNCQYIKSVLGHEVIHIMQQINYNFGMPPKKIKNDDVTDNTIELTDEMHSLSDVEFYPNLYTIYNEYKFNNLPLNKFIERNDILNYLHKHNFLKFKKTVKCLYKSIYTTLSPVPESSNSGIINVIS